MVALYAHLTALLHVVGNRFADKTKGATAVEYGIMVALIAVAIIATVTTLGSSLSTMFSGIAGKIKAP